MDTRRLRCLGAATVLTATAASVPAGLGAASATCPARGAAISVPGGSLYYEECGRGPVVVLIHGGNTDRRMWDAEFQGFSRGFRVVRYDVRGFGRSRGRGVPYASHEDLKALLDTLGVARADLVGLSLGGRIAIDFALEHPDRVRRLVLAGPGLSGFPWSNDMASFRDRFRQAVERRDSIGAALIWLETPYMTAAMEQPGLRDPLRRLATENASSWVQPDRERELEPPAIGRLRSLAVPTLIIVGSRDVPDIHRIVDTVVAQAPHARLIRLEGAGHMVNLEQPERFSRTVLDFLRAP